jgi:pimeloyl-ACP methyl ester carboxylesterase
MLTPTGRASGASTERLTLRATAGRDVSVHRWRPSGPVSGRIHFSHGANSAPWKYRKLIEPLVSAGFEVWAPLHVDSTDHPDTAQFSGMASWAARLEDMQLIAAQNRSPYHAVGHSYGALTALTLGGVETVWPESLKRIVDTSAVQSVIALSPPGPIAELVSASGYSRLVAPSLIQTGDRDVPPNSLARSRWEERLTVYDAAPADGNRYAVILDGVDHYFGNAIGRPEIIIEPQTQQLELLIDIAVLFLYAYGAGSTPASNNPLAALHTKLMTIGGALILRK